LRRLLDYGIPAHGFACARCAGCGHDFLMACSCKCRRVCTPCTTGRMMETAAHLADHVIPRLPVRRWVLAVHRSHHHTEIAIPPAVHLIFINVSSHFRRMLCSMS